MKSRRAAAKKKRASKERSTKPALREYKWRHDGIVASKFRSATSADEPFAHRLVFEYKMSLKIDDEYVQQPGVETISLHEIVAGELGLADNNMHVAALSDFMKGLFLTAPTAAGMLEKLESTGLDPIARPDALALMKRTLVYRKYGN